MTRVKCLQALRRVKLLSDLSEVELDRFLDASRPVEVGAGETIMREGEAGDSMYLFASGEVDVSKNLTMKIGKKGFGTAEKSMTKLKADRVSVFGEMALFEKEPRSATITASTDCLMFEVARDAFAALCAEDPGLGLKIVRRIAVIMSGRIRKGNDDVLKLSTALSIALSK